MLNGLSINRYIGFFFISLLNPNLLFAAVSAENNKPLIDINAFLLPANKPTFLRGLQPVFSFTAGATMSQLGQSQSFAPIDLCSYSYQPQGLQTTMLWGGFIGSEFKRTPVWELITGLGYYQPNTLSTKGQLTQGADPTSESAYSYQYQVQSQQLLAESRWVWIATEKIRPFLMLGIGATFNKTSDYQTTVPPFFEFTPAFSSHTQTNFTYALGPGIDISLSKSFRIGLAYRFTDLGSANTGSAQIDAIPISSTLKQSKLYANQMLAQLTFIPWTKD